MTATIWTAREPEEQRPRFRPKAVAAAMAVVGLTLASAVFATAAGADESERPPVGVIFAAKGATVSVPRDLQAGAIRFHVTNTDVAPHSLTVFSLKQGMTLQKTLADIEAEGSAQGPLAAAATRNLVADAVFVGGVDINPASTLNTTSLSLPAGTYYAVDPTPAFAPGGHVALLKTLHVSRSRRDDDEVTVARTRITMTKADRFQLSGRLRANGRVTIDNDSDTIHFVDLVPVRPGTTDAQLQAFFDSFGPHGPTLPDPETGPPAAGENVVSPHTAQVLSYQIPPGDYALECFINDDVTGMPHAFMGMHLIVHVN